MSFNSIQYEKIDTITNPIQSYLCEYNGSDGYSMDDIVCQIFTGKITFVEYISQPTQAYEYIWNEIEKGSYILSLFNFIENSI